MGIIESLEMHQFMCHKYLTFSLGPQINFIIGELHSSQGNVVLANILALFQVTTEVSAERQVESSSLTIFDRRQECSSLRAHSGTRWQGDFDRARYRSQVVHSRGTIVSCSCIILCFALTFRSVSEVTVVLKNQGEEAYRPKEYGKSIVITRRFTKDGASSYKIKNRDGKVISTKREELQAICDHMNIQVDNPMNVLTQGLS